MSYQRMSRLFQPLVINPYNLKVQPFDGTSISQKLLIEQGIVRGANPGCYHLLPLGVRAVEKLIKLIDTQMKALDAQKIEMPLLTNSDLWHKTGRINSNSSELFTVVDRHTKKMILNPTNEEAVTDLMSAVSPISYRQLPLRLYQITNKFRDEMKPRYGLLRSRQFLMKDLYTFDSSVENAEITYQQVSTVYERILDQIGVNYVKVQADCGNIGGSISHEYHYLSPIGEDYLTVCEQCGLSATQEVNIDNTNCPKECNIRSHTGIEVAHTFLLGERYSKPLKATYFSPESKPQLLQMGCYGLGVTRILAAALEILSAPTQLIWPKLLAPFTVIVIPPKAGSKEEHAVEEIQKYLLQLLISIPELRNDVIVDDRDYLTIGKRVREARKTGFPFIVIVGADAAANGQFELIDVNSIHTFNDIQLIDYILKKI